MKKAIVLLTLILVLAVPAVAGAKGKAFTVGESVVRWSTPETFRRSEFVTVRFRINGRELTGVEVRRGCVFDYTGYGLVVRLWACDNGSQPSPIRLRIASARENPAKVRMTYWR